MTHTITKPKADVEPIKADRWRNLFVCQECGQFFGARIWTTENLAKEAAEKVSRPPFVIDGIVNHKGKFHSVDKLTGIFQIPVTD